MNNLWANKIIENNLYLPHHKSWSFDPQLRLQFVEYINSPTKPQSTFSPSPNLHHTNLLTGANINNCITYSKYKLS